MEILVIAGASVLGCAFVYGMWHLSEGIHRIHEYAYGMVEELGWDK